MTTDRKLLELSAKAAGVEILEWWDEFNVFVAKDARIECDFWGPLNNRGQALWLAVTLGFSIQCSGGVASAMPNDSPRGAMFDGSKAYTEVTGFNSPNDVAATCRAIVRAAAEIGRAMS